MNKTTQAIERLLDVMRKLRDPACGCPWDRRQTMYSILPYSFEEIYELADAVERENSADICDELGDLLFHIVFYTQMAAEQGEFTFTDVAARAAEKLIRRHPHVFGDAAAADATGRQPDWEAIKDAERRRHTGNRDDENYLDAISDALPAMRVAEKLQKRAALVGFDWDNIADVLAKVNEETAELRSGVKQDGAAAGLEEELGDLLFACVNSARHLELDPELALRKANRKFRRRFTYIERTLAGRGSSLTAASTDEMESLWQEAKRLPADDSQDEQ